MLGNGVCEEKCNTLECLYDNGDCTCHPGCSISDFQSCKAECLNYECGYANFGKESGCNDPYLLELALASQALSRDFFAVFNWTTCLAAEPECTSEKLKDIWSSTQCYSVGDGSKLATTCATKNCAYALGAWTLTVASSCIRGFGLSNSECLKCYPGSMRLHSTCMPHCARRYQPNEVFPELCTPRVDNSSSDHYDTRYVAQSEFEGEGTLEKPYGSLGYAFAAMWMNYSIIYLLGDRVQLSFDTGSTNPDILSLPSMYDPLSAANFSQLGVASYTCSEQWSEYCSNRYTEIDIVLPISMTINFPFAFYRVIFTNSKIFDGLPVNYCPYLEFQSGVWRDGIGDVVSEDYVTASQLCGKFSDYSVLHVKSGGQLRLIVRTTQEVIVANLTMQPNAFIRIEGGDVSLENVTFSFVHTDRQVKTGGVILQLEACGKATCGSFQFVQGRVEYLNNAVGFIPGLSLSPFIHANSLHSVLIDRVHFAYNYVINTNINSALISDNAMIYLENFYRLAVTNCYFGQGLVSGGQIVVNSFVTLPRTTFPDRLEAEWFQQRHILLENLTFEGLIGEHSLVHMKFSGDVLNIEVLNVTFNNCGITGDTFIIFESALEQMDAITYGSYQQIYNSETQATVSIWLAPRDFKMSQVRISNVNSFMTLLHLGTLANIRLTDFNISNSGGTVINSLMSIYLFSFISNPKIVNIKIPKFPASIICSNFIRVIGSKNLNITSLKAEKNQCSGSCGVRVTGNSGFTVLTNYLSTSNQCPGVTGLAIDCPEFVNITMTKVAFSGNVNTAGEMGRFGYGSYVSITDSEVSDNSGVYGSGFYLSSVQSFTSRRVMYRRNRSLASRGGALYWSVGNLLPAVIDVQDSVFDSNTAVSGGGLAIEAINATFVSLVIRNCTFEKNEATQFGAGVVIGLSVGVKEGSVIERSMFTGQKSEYGALHLSFSEGILVVSDCSFVENIGSKTSALLIETGDTTLTLMKNIKFLRNKRAPVILEANPRANSTFYTENCWFEDNELSAIYTEGGEWKDTNSTFLRCNDTAVIITGGTIVRIDNALFQSHYTALSGGVMHLMISPRLTCTGCRFINNTAAREGGVVFAEQDSTVELKACIFHNNTAYRGGSAFFLTSSEESTSTVESTVMEFNDGKDAGTVYVQSSTCYLRNVTIRSNLGKTNTGITVLLGALFLSGSELAEMKGSRSSLLSLFRSHAVVSDTAFRDMEVANGGHFSLSVSSTLLISSSSFTRLKAHTGGVVSAYSESVVTLADVTMTGVKSVVAGSLLVLSETNVTISRSTFHDYSLGGIVADSVLSASISDSHFDSGRGSEGAALYCYNCQFIRVANSRFQDHAAARGGAIYLENVEGVALGRVSITDCHFLGNSANETGGAAYITNFHAEIEGGEFVRNAAESGGALELACSSPGMCAFALSDLNFAGNIAAVKGGAVSWTTVKPTANGLTFSNNSAQYGDDVASFPIALAMDSTASAQRMLGGVLETAAEVAPGQVVNFALAVSLRDHYNNTISIDNESSCTIESSGHSSVSGTTKVIAINGICIFDSFIVYAQPNSTAELSVTSPTISSAQEGDPDPHFPTLGLTVSVRDCVPGESKSAESCTVCPAGTYSLDVDMPCKNCPANADCLGNVTVVPKKGYWRSSGLSEVVRECPNLGACLGGELENGTLSVTGVCADGYKGNMCQSCAYDYSRTGKNKCSRCPSQSSNVARLTFIAVAMVLVLAVMVWSTLRSATRPTATHSVMIRIFVNYTQLVLLVTDFKLSWPKPVLDLFEVQESAGGATEQAYSVDCFLDGGKTGSDSYFRKMQLMALLPIPLIIGAVLFWAVVALRRRKLEIMKRDGAATVIIIFFLILPDLVKSMFSMFSCTEIEPGEYWLTINMDIRCWDDTHTANIFAVALPAIIAWIIGVPCISLGILIRFRRRHDEMWIKLQYGFLINGYRRSRYYWEFIILYRKIVVICCAVFLNNSIAVQALTVQLVLIACCVLQYIHTPYTTEQLNSLEVWGILVAGVTIYCGLYYLTQDVSVSMSWFLFILILVINVLFVVYWLAGLLNYFFLIASHHYPWLRSVFQPGQFQDKYIDHFVESCEETPNMQNVAQMRIKDVYKAMIGQEFNLGERKRLYKPRKIEEIAILTSMDIPVTI